MAITQAMAAEELGYMPWTETLCANRQIWPEGPSNCGNPAAKVTCENCGLVEYCSERCRKEDRQHHDVECKAALHQNTWIPRFAAELRSPKEVFALGPSEERQLWDTLPAKDLANLDENEGADLDGEFRVYIPNALDLRNVIETVSDLPGNFNGKLKFVINSPDAHVVARNLILLQLAGNYAPNLAAEMMIHLWYSARLTNKMLDNIQEEFLPAMERLCQAWPSSSTTPAEITSFMETGLVKTCELTIQLQHSQLDSIIKIFNAKHDISRAMSSRYAVLWHPDAHDRKDIELGLQRPEWRTSTAMYEKGGVLAPVRAKLDPFNAINPTLFDPRTSMYLLSDMASPLHGWDIDELRNYRHAFSGDDLHGQLYASLRNRLAAFAARLQSGTRVSFHITCNDILETKHLAEHGPFDRIDTGQLLERDSIGLSRLLHQLGPLVQPPALNPHAILITTFTHDWYHQHRDLEQFDHDMLLNIGRLSVWGWNVTSRSPAMQRAVTGLAEFAAEVFEPFDAIWETFVRRSRLGKLERRVGMRLREDNEVVVMWPRRLIRKVGTVGAKEAFEALMAAGTRRQVRVGEWVRGGGEGGKGKGGGEGKGDGGKR